MADSSHRIAPEPLDHHAYDHAMAQRLAQLHAALGEKMEPVLGEATPAPPPDAGTRLPRPRRGHSNASLIACCLLSAAASAGLTAWWHEAQPALMPTAAPSQPTSLALPGQSPPKATISPVVPARSTESPAAQAQATEHRAAPVATPPIADDSPVRSAAERWREAWSRRDVAAYLASYSQDFVPADGQPRDKWAEARRRNLMSRSDITVRISQLDAMPLSADSYRLVFLQDYRSGSFEERGQPKTLLMVREGKDWRIAGEWQGIRDLPTR